MRVKDVSRKSPCEWNRLMIFNQESHLIRMCLDMQAESANSEIQQTHLQVEPRETIEAGQIVD
jgi:hypothetical protein